MTTTFTQAEREKMVKLFEDSTQCRLSPKALLRDEWFHSSHLIYDGAYAKLIAMIRGEQPAAPMAVSPLPAAQRG